MTPEEWKRICAVLDQVLDAPADERAAALADACRAEGVDVTDARRFLIDETRYAGFLSAVDPAVLSDAFASMGAETLTAGTRLGVYEIVGPLGAGGMGEVYRARDAALRREVALKLLPPLFTKDPDRVARFTREAHALAALSHPNIAAIHGLEQGDTPALVLELVEGSTLAERLALGAIPLDEALPLARQIAEALAAAHEQGIVHRDLKPANIKIRPDGLVKVLDFGLAKFLESDALGGESAGLPTVTSPVATRIGTIVGTAAYLAPEQARGHTVDKRADIWAFGCVLFEMLTSRRLFEAETVSDTLALVLTRDPDWTSLPARTPASLRRLLRRCLVKDQRKRLADISDARLEIDDASKIAAPTAADETAAESGKRVRWRLPAAIAVNAAALIALWVWLQPPVPPPPVVMRFTAPGPPNRPSLPVLSRDGSQFAFQRQGPSPDAGLPSRVIYIRRMEELEAHALPASDNAMDPTFSPDGKWLAYLTSSSATRTPQVSNVRQLKKISVAGGLPQTLLEGIPPGPTERTWNDDDWIYFTSIDRLLRVRSSGGTAETLATLDRERGEFQFNAPQPLPGGKSVVLSVATNGDRPETRVVVLDLETRERRTLLENAGVARYAPSEPRAGRGHLIYGRNGALFAAPFDAVRRQLTGVPVRVIEGVRGVSSNPNSRNASFGFSFTGTLAYVPEAAVDVMPVWVDRRGTAIPLPLVPGQYFAARLAPDDDRIALLIRRGTDNAETDLWAYEFAHATLTRLSFDGDNDSPVWAPDGKRLIYVADMPSQQHAIVSIAADGSGKPQLLFHSQERLLPMAITPDARTLIVRRDRGTGAATSSVFLTLKWSSDSQNTATATPLFESRFRMGQLSLSPDGHWAAYESSESGREEIYVIPFPAADRKWQISAGGGTQPLWSRNGRELFYRSRDEMMAVPVETSPTFRSGTPAALFSGQYRPLYDVDRNGRFFMGKMSETPPGGYHIVVNWFEELRRRAPTDGPPR